MTVAELIEKLKELPQDAEVWCENYDISFKPNEAYVDIFKTVVITQS